MATKAVDAEREWEALVAEPLFSNGRRRRLTDAQLVALEFLWLRNPKLAVYRLLEHAHAKA